MAQPTPIRGLSPSSRVEDAARRILAGRLADVRYPEGAMAEGLTVDGVHDMRVAVRRLRAALNVFAEAGPLEKVERQVKRLQDALGEVRDVHVQLAWLAEAGGEERPRRRGGLKALREEYAAGFEDKEARLRGELKRWAARTVPALLRQMGRLEAPWRYGGKRVRRRLRWRLRRVEKRMAHYQLAGDGASAHELRKELKKLRYELEIFQPAFRRTLGALLEMLVPLQNGLGELHDADVRLERLERTAAQAPVAERQAARKLLARVREERTRRAGEIARELQRWQTEQLTRGLRRMLH